MNSIQMLSSVLGLGFASGVNLYAAVLMVGLGLRFHWISGLPGSLDTLANPIVLIVAGVMYFLEFFADKIPYVSVAWDSVHTVIRPLGGAALALASASHLRPELQAAAVLVGGSMALGSHSTKMGYRMIAHSSPEPVSGSIFSLAEDFGVVGLVLLIYKHPLVALCLVGGLIVGMAIALPMIIRTLVLLWSGLRGRFSSWFAAPNSPGLEDRQVYSCFARRLPGVPRLSKGNLVLQTGQQPRFEYRKWFRARSVLVNPAPGNFTRGLIYDQMGADGKWSVYLTKDCSPGLDRARSYLSGRPTTQTA